MIRNTLAAILVLLSAITHLSAETKTTFPNWTRMQSTSETALASVRRSDASARDSSGAITKLTPEEHLRRANIYLANRAFPEARSHWQALINYYPTGYSRSRSPAWHRKVVFPGQGL